ncbi:ABC transporter ATP-binding protein/permease [Halosquirtibacter laminarini]|uniref:ABC transporter ATP-binding protein/permease n=1 Tax=Halosquirtibacter laminarini TaxID=3374600 RepID=A0AC61NFN2_9BACT|nr:ABC transporter ATP-binding protein/permease [Prolixibacteraceae bacterium]
MKYILDVFKRYLIPYKGKVFLTFLYNVLGAFFGAISFASFSPILGVLFKTQKMVSDPGPLSWTSIDSLKMHLNYYVSQLIVSSDASSVLLLIGLFMLFMVFLKVGFTYLAIYVMVPLRNNVVRDIRVDLYNKVTSLPIGFFSEERKGDIIARMTGDVSEVEASVMNSLEMFFKNPVIILVSLSVMIAMSWQLTIFVFVLLPVVGYFIGRVGKSLKKPSMKGQNKMGEILSRIEETLTGLRIIQAFNAEKSVRARFYEESNDLRNIMNGLMWRRALAHPMSEFLGTAVIVIVLWYGGSLVLMGSESPLAPEEFITYLVFFYSIINPAKAFSTALYSIQKGMASMERIDAILNAEVKVVDGTKIIAKDDFKEHIKYDNVSFKYKDNGPFVLKNVDVEIKKGQTVAFVGQSGSGKSTLVDLLPRFWDVVEGKITIDGVDIRDFTSHSLRDLMGNVNQEPILFNDSFYNNITFGVEDATIEQVIDAAKVANAHEFIIATEDGYESNIGDRGSKLSGGQRQRVSIARAVLKNPPIMILDEATSALDTESEVLVQQALDNLMKNRTSIVVAHRLSTIRNADLICVFDKGEIVEMGTHKSLYDANNIYRKLVDMQMHNR